MKIQLESGNQALSAMATLLDNGYYVNTKRVYNPDSCYPTYVWEIEFDKQNKDSYEAEKLD